MRSIGVAGRRPTEATALGSLTRKFARVAEGANAKTPCFMGHGTEDNVVLPECGEDAKTRFEAAGVPVNFSTYRMPHSTCGAEMRAVREFLREVLQLG